MCVGLNPVSIGNYILPADGGTLHLEQLKLARSLTIDFDPKQADSFDLTHRVRNFGEDVYRYLQTTGWGEIELAEVDAAMTQLTIRGIKHSTLRRVTVWIGDEMNRHHLFGSISS